MKQTVLNRYETTPDGSIIIDVTASCLEDLYNNFDKSAPYIRRDLDQDLVDYLIACVRELNNNPFVIRFSLTKAPDPAKLSRIRQSIKSYFHYLIEIEYQKFYHRVRKSAILFGIGLTLLVATFTYLQPLNESKSILTKVLTEGLAVAAWVALWESLAVLLIDWIPLHRTIRLYKKIANANLAFKKAKKRKSQD